MAAAAEWVPFNSINTDILQRYMYPIEKSVQTLTGVEAPLETIQLASV